MKHYMKFILIGFFSLACLAGCDAMEDLGDDTEDAVEDAGDNIEDAVD